MLKAACLIARKDLRLVLSRGAGLVQALLLGLLLIFVFSLSRETGETMSGQGAATIFWLSSAFCQVLSFNMLYGLEEANGSRAGLLAPAHAGPVRAARQGGGGPVHHPDGTVPLSSGDHRIPRAVARGGWPLALLALVLTDIGMASLGSLLGALSQGQAARESLLSIVLFPLIIPILLAGIRVCAGGFSEALPEGVESWLGIAVAFDAVFLARRACPLPLCLFRRRIISCDTHGCSPAPCSAACSWRPVRCLSIGMRLSSRRWDWCRRFSTRTCRWRGGPS